MIRKREAIRYLSYSSLGILQFIQSVLVKMNELSPKNLICEAFVLVVVFFDSPLGMFLRLNCFLSRASYIKTSVFCDHQYFNVISN